MTQTRVKMRWSRRVNAQVLGAVFVAVLAGAACSTSREDGGATRPVKLAFVTNNSSEFWKIAAAGVRKYESEGRVQVDVKMPPNGTPEEQNQIIENLASQGYDAIAVSAVAPNDQVPVLNRVAAQTALITFDSDAPKSNRLLYIGTNNYEAGRALGGEIVKILPKGGNIAVFVGSFSADNAAQRFKGIQDAINGHNIIVVDRREDGTDRAKARSNVEDIVNAHRNLNLVAGLWSYNGPAIAAALESLGRKGEVLAAVFDEEAGTLQAIADGTIICTVVQKPFQFGYLASKWMHELATKADASRSAIPPGKIIDTGVEVITKDNVAEFSKQLDALKQ